MYTKLLALVTITYFLISSSFAEVQEQGSTKKCVDMSLLETQIKVHEQKSQPFTTPLPLDFSKDYLKKRYGDFKVLFEEVKDDQYREVNERQGKLKIEDWEFDGLILTVISAYPAPSKINDIYRIKQITISKNKYALSFPIKIGSTIEEVQCYLGKIPKNKKNDKRIVYPTVGNFDDVINVTLYFDKNHLVEQIEFEYHYEFY